MKRDMTLVRRILEYAEDEDLGAYIPFPKPEGYTPEQVAHHMDLCREMGYLAMSEDFERGADTNPDSPVIRALTWAGHDALDGMRREDRGRGKTDAAGTD